VQKKRFREQRDKMIQGINASKDRPKQSLDTATGQPAWKYSANNSWILTTATAADHVIYTGTSDTYLLLALDAATGKEKFRVTANGYVYSSPTIAANTIFFGDFTGQLLAADRLSGEIIDRFETFYWEWHYLFRVCGWVPLRCEADTIVRG